MTRRLMSMGLALAAVVALGAVVASGAQAAPEFFHSHVGEKNPDSVIGTAEATGGTSFKTKPSGGVEVICSSLKFEGTGEVTITQKQHEEAAAKGEKLNGTFTHENASKVKTLTDTSATATPTYSGCVAFGFTATVTTTGCHYQLTAETKESQGRVHLECEAGKKITVSAGGCVLEFGNQTPAGGIHYTNNEAGLDTKTTYDVSAQLSLTEIEYTAAGFACALLGISSAKTGVTEGSGTAKGFEDEEKTSTGTYKEGKQVGIWGGPTK